MKEKNEKNLTRFLRKRFLFLIPLILLLLYFSYPIPVEIFKGLSQTANQKERVNDIIASYEYAISSEGIEQCIEECMKDPGRYNLLLYHCKDRCRRKVYSPEEISSEEISECVKSCEEHDKLLSECEWTFCNKNIIADRDIYTNTINGIGVNEIKQSSFLGLFLKNFSRNLNFSYQKIIRNFSFQSVLILLLGLILYYGVLFGILIVKKLEKKV